MSTREVGNAAEKKACDFLKQKGLVLVSEQYRSRCGEIDLIMKDKHELVFIEVRSRTYSSYGTGIDSIDRQKQKKIIRSATTYLQKKGALDNTPCRFDVIGIAPDHIEWIKDAFSDE